MSKNQTLTSVKLDSELFDEFKMLSIKTKMTWQKLAERAMYNYVIDEEFRNKIHNTFINKLDKSE